MKLHRMALAFVGKRKCYSIVGTQTTHMKLHILIDSPLPPLLYYSTVLYRASHILLIRLLVSSVEMTLLKLIATAGTVN